MNIAKLKRDWRHALFPWCADSIPRSSLSIGSRESWVPSWSTPPYHAPIDDLSMAWSPDYPRSSLPFTAWVPASCDQLNLTSFRLISESRNREATRWSSNSTHMMWMWRFLRVSPFDSVFCVHHTYLSPVSQKTDLTHRSSHCLAVYVSAGGVYLSPNV